MAGKEDGTSDFKGASESLGGSIGKQIKSSIEQALSTGSIEGIMRDIDTQYSKVAATMGVGRESSDAIRQAFGDAYSDVLRIGGGMSDLSKIQNDVVKNLGRNVIMSGEYFDDLLAAEKTTNQTTDVLIGKFKDAGYSLYNVAKEMEGVVNTARSLGVSAEKVSASVVSNMSALDTHNFSGGVAGLAKMAATSASLRVDMSSVLAAVDKAFDPEGAIEMAASFQRLGVAQSDLLDPMRLMNMSRNDPEEFQKAIGEMAKGLTTLDEKGNVKIAPGQVGKMKELAKTLGMSTNEFATMARAAGEMEIKMQKIQFPSIATEEQKQMLANIVEMKDGEMKINVDGKMTDLNEALKSVGGDKEKLNKLLESSQPKDMLTLAKEQTTYLADMSNSMKALVAKPGAAIGGSKMGGKVMQAENQLFTGTADVLTKAMDIRKMREGFDENMGGVTTALYKLTTGEGSLEDVGKSFWDAGQNFAQGITNIYNEAKKGSAELYKNIQSGDNEITKGITNALVGAGDLIIKAEQGKGEEFFNGVLKPSTQTMSDEKIASVAKSTGMSVEEFKQFASNANSKEKEQKTNENKTTLSGDMTLNIKVDAPSNVDTTQLSLALGDPEVKAKIIEILEKYESNNNTKKHKD
jgi:hypothetical protein